MKIVKSLEESGLVIKGVTQISKNEVKEQRGGFLGIHPLTNFKYKSITRKNLRSMVFIQQIIYL